jgi:hypothetical protein
MCYYLNVQFQGQEVKKIFTNSLVQNRPLGGTTQEGEKFSYEIQHYNNQFL